MKVKDLILRDLAVCPDRAIDSVMGIDVQQEVSRGHSREGVSYPDRRPESQRVRSS